MRTFNEFMVEMTINDAKKTLSIDGQFTDKELKTARARASSKAHPDKGGSTEDQQRVNAAYEILKNNAGKAAEIDFRAQREQSWRDLAAIVLKDMVKNFNLKVYTKHFESIFGESFNMVVTKMYPDDDELKRMSTKRAGNVPHFVNYDIEWTNHDRTKVFQLGVSVYMATLMGSGGLSSPGTTYQMGISTFAYINGRKVKITKRDYDHTAKKSVWSKPETVFPKKKVDRKKQTKFKKSDMLSALKAEIRAEFSGDYIFIPLKGDKYLAITRNVMMRVAYWSIHGIWYKPSKYGYKADPDHAKHHKFMSLPEDEDTLGIFRKAKNGDPKKVMDNIEAIYKKMIK